MLVLALTIFAASPTLHEQLHDRTHTHHDESCAVVLFAGSADAPASPLAASAPLPIEHTLVPTLAREIFLSLPRYLRQPERGPPSSLNS